MKNTDIENNIFDNFDDTEYIETSNDFDFSTSKDQPNHVFDIPDSEQENCEQTDFDIDETDTENYDDVLQLTEYSDGMLTTKDTYGVVAEYNEISIQQIDEKYKLQAKNFVGKITKFIIDFEDVELTDRHKRYLSEVGKLQMSNLQDMLVLVDMNKQMLQNVINRVNATQIEDYAIIESYNKLLNQQIKLMKELQTTYKSIPSTMKKMRNDILLSETNEQQQLQQQQNDVVTDDYGESQFNNGKQLLRSLREKIDKERMNGIKISDIS